MRSCTPRSTRASRCSTRPTPTARARHGSASSSRAGATTSSSRRSSAATSRRRGNDNGEDWGARGSRRYITRAVESSLRRLRTDWIDLYQLHRPDEQTPIEETLSALDDLVHAGQGALPRLVQLHRVAGRRRRVDLAHARTRTVRLARRTSTAGSSATSRTISCRRSSSTASGCCRSSRSRTACSPASTGAARHAPEGSRIKAWGRESVLTDETFDVLEKLEAFAAERGVDHARRRDRRAGSAAGRGERDRRRDDAASRCVRTSPPATGRRRPPISPTLDEISAR